jgi:hypothetical protein
LDQGKDYFDLLLPFVERVLAKHESEMVHTEQARDALRDLTSLQVPLRTVSVLLDRLTRAGKLRKEAGAYFIHPDARAGFDLPVPDIGTAGQFEQLGQDFADHAAAKGIRFIGAGEALEELATFLDENGASLLLGEKPSPRKLSRRNSIAAASFIAIRLTTIGPEGEIVSAFLQGLILRRAVLLSDIATLQKRLDRVVVYLDTPHLLSLAGLYGPLEHEASREGCRLLRGLGVIVGAFDVTIAEMRRILAVYEDRIDSADGRASLDYNSLTRYFFSIEASSTDVKMRAALLEVTLKKEGVVLHSIPERITEYVEDEKALGEALKDYRGPQKSQREYHDVDCIAAVLTLRKGSKPTRWEDARAVFAASGRVVISVMEWWNTTGYSGLPPIIAYNSLLNYCWLKRPSASSAILRHELAALCADILKPSKEAWSTFVQQLQRMVAGGLVDSDEAAALLIDDLSAKYVVDAETSETMEASTMVEVIDRLRDQQRREITQQADQLKAVAAQERLRLQAQLDELRRSGDAALALQAAEHDQRISQVDADVASERARADEVSAALERVADLIASLVSYGLSAIVIILIVSTAIFPLVETVKLPSFLQGLLKSATILITLLGGLFGFAALPAHRALRGAVKRRLIGTLGSSREEPKRLR